jgi:hypothetical protein
MVGKPESTIRGWIERGMAYPNEEPWGSFSVQYRQAERGVAIAAAKTSALRVQVMLEQMEEFVRWRDRGPPPPRPRAPEKPGKKASADEKEAYRVAKAEHDESYARWELDFERWKTPPAHPDVSDMVWLESHRQRRFPEDYGASKHRKPEAEFDGQHWLDAHAMDREQLKALFTDPPELIRLAMEDAGCWPPRGKAEDADQGPAKVPV